MSAGKYHVRRCDLNAPHLVAERAERAWLWRTLETQPGLIKHGCSESSWKELKPLIDVLQTQAELTIPKIKFLSGKALEDDNRPQKCSPHESQYCPQTVYRATVAHFSACFSLTGRSHTLHFLPAMNTLSNRCA